MFWLKQPRDRVAGMLRGALGSLVESIPAGAARKIFCHRPILCMAFIRGVQLTRRAAQFVVRFSSRLSREMSATRRLKAVLSAAVPPCPQLRMAARLLITG